MSRHSFSARRFLSDLSIPALVMGVGGAVGMATGKFGAALLVAAPISVLAVIYDRRWRGPDHER